MSTFETTPSDSDSSRKVPEYGVNELYSSFNGRIHSDFYIRGIEYIETTWQMGRHNIQLFHVPSGGKRLGIGRVETHHARQCFEAWHVNKNIEWCRATIPQTMSSASRVLHNEDMSCIRAASDDGFSEMVKRLVAWAYKVRETGGVVQAAWAQTFISQFALISCRWQSCCGKKLRNSRILWVGERGVLGAVVTCASLSVSDKHMDNSQGTMRATTMYEVSCSEHERNNEDGSQVVVVYRTPEMIVNLAHALTEEDEIERLGVDMSSSHAKRGASMEKSQKSADDNDDDDDIRINDDIFTLIGKKRAL